MARLPYKTDDDAGPAALVDAIRARRGGELLNLDRMLLHSPALAEAWNGFLGSVRTELGVPAKLRELAMCAVAVVNGADYEFVQHAPLYLKAGATQAQADALRDLPAAAVNTDLFDQTERAVIGLTLAMTRDVSVDEATFSAAATALENDPRDIVEIVAVIGAYNMVSRFLVALHIEPEN